MIQVRKNSLNIKFLGRIFLGHPEPRRRDVPDKNFLQVAFFCCFRHGVAGMSRDLGRDVPDLEKLYARKLWADFSYPSDLNCDPITIRLICFQPRPCATFRISPITATRSAPSPSNVFHDSRPGLNAKFGQHPQENVVLGDLEQAISEGF